MGGQWQIGPLVCLLAGASIFARVLTDARIQVDTAVISRKPGRTNASISRLSVDPGLIVTSSAVFAWIRATRMLFQTIPSTVARLAIAVVVIVPINTRTTIGTQCWEAIVDAGRAIAVSSLRTAGIGSKVSLIAIQ